jgi:tetratricopeptide (TPR) repeat protein
MDDYKGLERTGSQLLKTAVLSEADRGSIEEAIRRARTKQLQSMGGAFGSKEYAENLLSVASKYKGSALGVQALYEAFNSLKSKRDPELFEVGEAFLDQHADSGNAKEVASSMAMLALSTASFDRAARYLTRFAEKYPKEKESLEFKKTAAMLFERQADFKKARQAYLNLGDREGVARMDLALNDWTALEASSVDSGSPNANYWRALAIWRQRRQQDALSLLKSLAAQGASRPDQSGHARFLLSQMALDRFRGIKMKSAEDQAALAEKVKAFQALSSELQELIKSGTGKWPIAALYLLGQTHYDLGRFIADSPLPPGLSEADKKAYMTELSNQAGSYLSEAEKVFSKCVDAAQGNDVFTRYVDGCRARGRKLIKEEDDVAHVKSKNAGVEPAKAKAIRAKLIENSKDVNLLLELGEIYMAGDQPQTAMGIFARVLEIEPENARAIASIGVASMSVDELDSAYGSFKQALKINPKESTALWNLAGLYKQFGFTNKLAAMRGQMSGLQAPKLLHPWSRGL